MQQQVQLLLQLQRARKQYVFALLSFFVHVTKRPIICQYVNDYNLPNYFYDLLQMPLWSNNGFVEDLDKKPSFFLKFLACLGQTMQRQKNPTSILQKKEVFFPSELHLNNE